MMKNFKKDLTAFIGVCAMATMINACGVDRTARAPGDTIGQQQDQTIQQIGINRDNNLGTTPQAGQGDANGTDIGQGDMLGTNTTNNQTGNTTPNQLNQQVPGQQMSPDRQKADTIKNQLKTINGIADVNVIVMGNTALVGYKPTADAGDINATKTTISDRVKGIDGTITNVSVTEQPEIMSRLGTLGNDVNNFMTNNFADEFNQIKEAIAPTAL